MVCSLVDVVSGPSQPYRKLNCAEQLKQASPIKKPNFGKIWLGFLDWFVRRRQATNAFALDTTESLDMDCFFGMFTDVMLSLLVCSMFIVNIDSVAAAGSSSCGGSGSCDFQFAGVGGGEAWISPRSRPLNK